MAENPIRLEPHDPRWAAGFEAERAALEAAGGGLFVALHHVGSTAIPGIAAKPVIDILVVLACHEDGLACIPAMQALGYEYRGANGLEGRHYFNRGTPHTHHVHMLPAQHPEVGRLLRFRDHLRAHPAAARAYEALKQELALRVGADRRAYAEAKTAFCDRIDRLALGL